MGHKTQSGEAMGHGMNTSRSEPRSGGLSDDEKSKKRRWAVIPAGMFASSLLVTLAGGKPVNGEPVGPVPTKQGRPMTAREQAASIPRYARQLLDHENVQSAARNAAEATAAAYRRARGRDVRQTVKDKRFRRRLRDAAQALDRAWIAITEPPRKPRHRARSAIVVLGAAGIGAAIFNRQLRTWLLDAVADSQAKATSPAGTEGMGPR
jgi:hypothetical protein